MVKNVVKRDGRLVEFNSQKIVAAILKAMDITEQGEDIVLAAKIADAISKQAPDKLGVEDIQDLVELELMKSPRKEVARKYIAYRNQRNLARKARTISSPCSVTSIAFRMAATIFWLLNSTSRPSRFTTFFTI